MKAYSIRDAAMPGRTDLAYLLYYEKSRRFCIELCESAGMWDLPPILSSFAARGLTTVDFHWSSVWVEQRIIPPDRQNLGMILREFGLKEYDPHALLLIARGRCAQDECYLSPLKEEQFPRELQERLNRKIRDIVPVSETRSLLIYNDNRIEEIHLERLSSLQGPQARLLDYYRTLSGLRISPGGQGLEWNPGQFIPLEKLCEAAEPARIMAGDLRTYIQRNLVSTGEAAEILQCSRQNINDLIRRGRLTPVREEKNNALFLRADIHARLMD